MYMMADCKDIVRKEPRTFNSAGTPKMSAPVNREAAGDLCMKNDQIRSRLEIGFWWTLHCWNFYVRLLESPHSMRLVRNRRKVATILYKLRNGLRIELSSGRSEHCLVEEIWMNKEYTNLKGFQISRTDTVIDIEAHKGVFPLYAGYLAKEGRVYSFEPHPSNYSFLQRNIERNNATNIRAFNLAVWSKPDKTKLKTSSSTLSHSLVFSTDGDDTIEVRCVGLREIFEQNRISTCDFLKIDAEGAEYEILLATPVQILARIDRIVVEVHPVPSWSPTRLRDLLAEHDFETTLRDRRSTEGHLLVSARRV